MTVEKQLIDKVESIRTTLNEISVYNLDVKTSLELYYELAKKVNEVITELSRFEGVVSEEVVEQNKKLLYLLGEGLKNQVGLKIDELIKNGTIKDLINNKIFSNKNIIINSFISKEEKKISDDIEKIANKIMRKPKFTLYNNVNKYQNIITISNKIFKEPENTDITKDDSHNKNN